MQYPTFVEIQYWNPDRAEWGVGHAGIALMNPTAYVKGLGKRGTIARAVDKETGETVYSEGADIL